MPATQQGPQWLSELTIQCLLHAKWSAELLAHFIPINPVNFTLVSMRNRHRHFPPRGKYEPE
jgi:hypothetical protein